ncbi:uncharacterized protein IWZ02DRAFT_160696 [Phyllosticta citriasiana]|uniref:uncharacterized protein n=1 Tax=Phyllosticta citriasiana TaxID=595635 RepID=UPI0030FD9E60
MFDFWDTRIDWQVSGERAVIQWHDKETAMDRYLGRLGEGNDGGLCSETPLTLWIGQDTDDVSRKLVFLNLRLKRRSSTSKPKTDVSLVLPVTDASVEMQNMSHASKNVALSVDQIHLAFSLNDFPFAVMPPCRRPARKPLDNVPGYLVECMRNLTKTKMVHVYVAKGLDGKIHSVMQDLVAAAQRESLREVALRLDDPEGSGEKLVNRWDLYPVTTDDLGQGKARCWNPYVEDQPPEYTEYTAGPYMGLGLPAPETVAGGSPDEKLEWRVCSTPKRKASASPPRERVTKKHLEELTQATEAIGTAEMLDLARAAKSAASSPSSVFASPGTSGTGQRYEDILIFNLPTLQAPSVSTPVSSTWRMQFSKTNSIFFDMVSLLQKALKHQPRTHEMHLSRFLVLGHLARKAVAAHIGPDVITTPCQDSTYEQFAAMRDELTRRVIVDMADTDSGTVKSPFPINPLDQVEYLRRWMNERVQVFLDTDVLEQLAAMRRAAIRVLDCYPLGAYSDTDPIGCEFEWARAAVLGAVFFNVGNQPLMAGREERSPVMWGHGHPS